MPDSLSDYGQKLASWKFPEYVDHKRGRGWYIGFFLVGGLASAYALFTANFLFMVIILIIWTIMYVNTKRKPVTLKMNVFEDGLQVEGRKFYPWEDVNSFWIIYRPPEAKYLYVNFKSDIRPDLVIPLERSNPVKIRSILIRYVAEDLSKEDESLSEILSREYKL